MVESAGNEPSRAAPALIEVSKALRDEIARHRYSPIVLATPLGKVLPLLEKLLQQLEAAHVAQGEVIAALAAVVLEKHYGRAEISPAQLAALQSVAGDLAQWHAPECRCVACFAARGR